MGEAVALSAAGLIALAAVPLIALILIVLLLRNRPLE